MARRDAGAARKAVDSLLAAHPGYAPGWLTASILALELGHAGQAIAAIDRGLTLAPGEPTLKLQRLRCLAAAARLSEALAEATTLEPAIGPDARLQHELGNVLSLLGDHARALGWLRKAQAALPDDPALKFNLATVLRFTGGFDDAETLLDEVIAARPDDWEAWGLRSQLRTQAPDRNHVPALSARLSPPPTAWQGQVQLRYALAKELEDLGRYEDSFAQLRLGAAARRRHLSYDVGGDVETLDLIRRTYDDAWLASAPRGPDWPAPIFVFGLPRSGTTLLERILSSHAEVASLGELNDMPIAVSAVAGRAPTTKQALVSLAAQAPDRIGGLYHDRVAPRAGSAPRFVDKLPMNELYAGLIAAGLPGARLVQVTRGPMASGYAMFKTLFQQGYPFSYDLDDLGRYIAAHLRLAAHWREVLKERVITIAYEDLVASQEAETRRLVAACGLDWDPACLSPQANPAASSTQSAVQVRRPIYGHAVEQWRRYADELAPLARRLAAEGVTLGPGDLQA